MQVPEGDGVVGNNKVVPCSIMFYPFVVPDPKAFHSSGADKKYTPVNWASSQTFCNTLKTQNFLTLPTVYRHIQYIIYYILL